MTYPCPLSGREIIKLMNRHHITIRELSHRMGITMKRIREVRRDGLRDPGFIRDWIEAITGDDPGPIN